MNPAYLSAISALAGSAIGALASFCTTWLTQHFQDRTQRKAKESARQERIYGDFIDEASKLYGDALHNSMGDPSKLVAIYAIFGKLRLFASANTIEAAPKVLDHIVHTYYEPNENFQLEAVAIHRLDILQNLVMSCRGNLRG